ncbi:hypothetical protein OIO90_004428 [Microbotryomycetes sp. JL221]|nr:hypothetical protein OIO90_004428 [Microbotryomycetes sp. JL221]
MTATAPPMQYALRSLKALGLVQASPSYAPVAQFQKPEGAVKNYRYSGDGRLFAYCTATNVQVLDANTGSIVSEIDIKGVIDLCLSPKGTQLQTWERHVKPAEGEPQHKNLKVWDVQTGQQLIGFSQKAFEGWQLQYSEDETKVVRTQTNELQVFDTSNFDKGVADKLRCEGVESCSLSPGRFPNVALFVPEKKGAPAMVKVHNLTALVSCSSQKTFFKADKIKMKWNKLGTNLLFLTQTEVDKTGKSYYGETNLYLMAAGGQFDCRVTLDKDGGIHDFDWSPNSREFAVTYGYMPAKTVLFDQRVNVIHDFGMLPRNFLSYNPQGRLLCIAGFGNLAGQVDIWDRKTLKKLCTIDAPNTSHCEWSPDGRFLMCATLSPRLRVDNGVRIFHCTGGLMHVDSVEELYQASWRPADVEWYPFTGQVEPAPTASVSVSSSAVPVKAAAPAGAYRPPHARGTVTPTLFKREDEGGAAYNPNGTSTFATNGRTSPNFSGRSARKPIPGAAIPGAASTTDGDNNTAQQSRRAKKKENAAKKAADGTATPVEDVVVDVKPAPEAISTLSPDDKKRRALVKKLTAIEQLKVKRDAGEKLELTQVKKLDSEAEIRKELAALDLGK